MVGHRGLEPLVRVIRHAIALSCEIGRRCGVWCVVCGVVMYRNKNKREIEREKVFIDNNKYNFYNSFSKKRKKERWE